MNRDRATPSRVGRSDQHDTVVGRATRTLVMDDGKTLTGVEAANILGIGRNTAYELARQGKLPGALRLGRRILVSRRALEAFLEGKGDSGGPLDQSSP